MSDDNHISRRDFLKMSSLLLAGFAGFAGFILRFPSFSSLIAPALKSLPPKQEVEDPGLL